MTIGEKDIEAIEFELQAQVATGHPPGLVAMVAQGNARHAIVVGSMSIGGPAMTRDAIFRIASMTKPITAAVAMMLVEEGALRLDEPIDRLAPELADLRVLVRKDGPLDETVPAGRPITLEDVLSFRLGWGIDFNERSPFAKAVADLPGFGMPNPAWPGGDDDFMQALGRLPLQAQPGERWLYTLGSNLLGVLIARAARQPLDAVFNERLFEPLGMQDTGFFVPPDRRHRLVTGYVNDEGRLAPFEPWNGLYAERPCFLAGDSGLVSTADDYATFARFMTSGVAANGRRLLALETLREMTVNRLTPAQRKDDPILGPWRGWGLGLGVQVSDSPDGIPAGAYGWDGGFGTSWFNDPARDLTAILLTQRVYDGPDAPAVHKAFWRALSQRPAS